MRSRRGKAKKRDCYTIPMRHGGQKTLFDSPVHLPNGLLYRPNFITEREEHALLDAIGALELVHPNYKGYAAKRRIANFGWEYDFENKRLIPGDPLPDFLVPLQNKIAKWLDIPKKRVVEALINEYEAGSALGWHKDNEPFEHIVGVSLQGWAKMRFRPIAKVHKAKDVVALELERRSAYIMQGAVRDDWQHSVAETRTLRYSITFRTLPARRR